MEKLKTMAKDLKVYILVIVVFVVLLGYKQLHPTSYKTVDADEVVSMIEDEKDFILVIGQSEYDEDEDDTDYTSETTEQNTYLTEYIKDYRQTVYYLDEDDIDDLSEFLDEYFDNSSSELPQTYFIVDGEVYRKREGTVKYYEFSKLVTDWKDKKQSS